MLLCATVPVAAVRTLTEGSGTSSRRSSSLDTTAAAAAADQQPQSQPTVNMAVTGLQGLQQGLAAALAGGAKPAATGSDDVEILISGQVRLQCSPVRQRPGSAAAAVDGGSAAVSRTAAGTPDRRQWGKSDPDAAAEAFAAQAKPLQDALRDVHSMIAEMESLCQNGGSANAGSCSTGTGRALAHKIAPAVAAAVVKACRGNEKQQLQDGFAAVQLQGKGPGRQLQAKQQPRSPDKHKLRGQLHGVQERLVKLEVKMNQAAAMQEDPCCCNSAAAGISRAASPSRYSPERRPASQQRSPGGVAQHQHRQGGCGACSRCKGGYICRGKRQALVGRMQDEIGQLQRELAELRAFMPGAYE